MNKPKHVEVAEQKDFLKRMTPFARKVFSVKENNAKSSKEVDKVRILSELQGMLAKPLKTPLILEQLSKL